MKRKKCSVKICKRESSSVTHKLCKAHLLRYYKGQELNTPIKVYKKHKPYGLDKK